MKMKLGIKVGPQKTSIPDLIATQSPFAEVYYDVNRLAEYNKLFNYLTSRKVETGLHYWATLENGIWSNIAYPDNKIISKSMSLIKQTIDMAARMGFVYVNIHPGSSALVIRDLKKETFRLASQPVPENISIQLFLKNVRELNAYARQKNVVLTVETVPCRVSDEYWSKPRSEQVPVNVYELPISAVIEAKNQGIAIANDFGHTAASRVLSDSRQIWRDLYSYSELLAPSTRLIHLGYLEPPFNGTDNHASLTDEIFQTDAAVPNIHQVKKLFQLYKTDQKIWILVEPNGGHVENYFAAQKLVPAD